MGDRGICGLIDPTGKFDHAFWRCQITLREELAGQKQMSEVRRNRPSTMTSGKGECERDEPKRCEKSLNMKSKWRSTNQRYERRRARTSGRSGWIHERIQPSQQCDVGCAPRKSTQANRDSTRLPKRANASMIIAVFDISFAFFHGNVRKVILVVIKGPSQEEKIWRLLRRPRREPRVCDVRGGRTQRTLLSEKRGGAMSVLGRGVPWSEQHCA